MAEDRQSQTGEDLGTQPVADRPCAPVAAQPTPGKHVPAEAPVRSCWFGP